MTKFGIRLSAFILFASLLLICGGAFAVPSADDTASPQLENILEQRASSRFAKADADETAEQFDPYSVSLEGFVIGIDPGHQQTEDDEPEQISPNDSVSTKCRMSAGAFGVRTGVAEYDIALAASAKLAALLQGAGATVVLSRTSNDVSISNKERAEFMNDCGVDFWVRVHCNSSVQQKNYGALMIMPSSSMDIYSESAKLGKLMLKSFCESTGAYRHGVSYSSTQTGFNWSASPVVTIEMGYLSNPQEELKLCRDSYQTLCADGMFRGIAAYCAGGGQ